MFRTRVVSVAIGRLGLVVLGIAIGAASIDVRGQTPPPQQPPPPAQPAQPPAAAQPAKNPYIFASDASMILNFIKADKTADFESVIAKLKDALAKSEKPERKQQAASWKIFKAAEPGPNGSVIYVSIMNPAVKGADYSVGTILAEAFPTEAQALYKTYSEAYGTPAQNILNLTTLADFGK